MTVMLRQTLAPIMAMLIVAGVFAYLLSRSEWQPSVEFNGVSGPDTCAMGATCTYVVFVKRNVACQSKGNVSWFSMDAGAIIPELSGYFDIALAPVTESFQPFAVGITIPEGAAPGLWVRNLTIIPGGKCAGDPAIVTPPIEIEVTAE